MHWIVRSELSRGMHVYVTLVARHILGSPSYILVISVL